MYIVKKGAIIINYIQDKKDLRVVKTFSLIKKTLFNLLSHTNFKRITVNDLCKHAKISRASFYAHFEDKYNLLNHCLKHIISILFDNAADKKDCYINLHEYIHKNKIVLRNLLSEADDETVKIIFDNILTAIDVPFENNDKQSIDYIIFSNFFAGGLIKYLYWHVENKFPKDFPVVNDELYSVLETLSAWYLKKTD